MRSRLLNKLNKLKSGITTYGVEHPWEQAEHKQSDDKNKKDPSGGLEKDNEYLQNEAKQWEEHAKERENSVLKPT